MSSIVASALDAIVSMDQEGRVLEWNPSAEEIFGYRRRDAVGRTLADLIVPPTLREAHWAGLTQYLATGDGQVLGRRVEISALRADGSTFPIELAIVQLTTAGPPTFTAFIRDLTERAKAEEATARLAAVVSSSIDGILTKDLTGRITSWNEACQRMFGYAADEAIGRPITMLYPRGEEMAEEAVLNAIRAGRPVRIREAKRVRKDGSTIWVSVSASPVRDASGKIVEAAAIKRDVTEERTIQRERQKAKGRAQELTRLREINRFKTQFINTAAHELRTPLLPLRMQLDLMISSESEPPTQGQREALEIMQRNLARLGGLVEDLLLVARSQAGRIELQLESVELGRTLDMSKESFQALATKQGIHFIVESAGAGTVMADPTRLSQVLSNLLGNACKFTPAGGTVKLSARADGKNLVRVSVADSGRGIALPDQGRLFHPFVQVHDVALTQLGSGLGLYICKQIIELHGGTIGVESEGIGKGSTFWFTVPRPTRYQALGPRTSDLDWTSPSPDKGASPK